MKNKIIILVIVFMIILSGCSKGNSNTIDVAIKKGDYSSICTKEEDSDGIKVTTVTTTNYGKDKYAISMKVKAVYEFESKDTFDFYAEEAENTAETYKKMKDTIYNYSTDENKRSITTVLGYPQLDIPEEEQEDYSLEKMIEDSEKDGGKCQLIGIARESIELNN